jgi:hypothetical protein
MIEKLSTAGYSLKIFIKCLNIQKIKLRTPKFWTEFITFCIQYNVEHEINTS